MTRSGHDRPNFGRLVAVTCAAALMLAAALAGCAPVDAGLQGDVARQLQARVLGVTQAAAGNDPATALAALESLEADLATASSGGLVSEDRRRTIMTAVAAVRADLTAAKAEAEAARAAEAAAAETAKADADAAARATQDAAAPVATTPAATAPADGGKGSGAKGKGKAG
ncbi:MAG TPA: mucin-associated surface protein [Arthrobacter sp.]|jgi:hypothetical protein